MTESSLTLRVSADNYQGNAQFIVLVDGIQVGGVQTVSASRRDGQSQDVTVQGAFGADPSKVSVTFINDVGGSTPQADRNLYVQSLTLNGSTYLGSSALATRGVVNGGTMAMYWNGTSTFNVAPSKRDSLTLRVSGDNYQGGAQFLVFVDGVQVGGVQTVTAAHGSASQTITLSGSFGAHPSKVAVQYINDFSAGTSRTDRNLYIESVDLNGSTILGSSAAVTRGTALGSTMAMYSNGTATFDLTKAVSSPGTEAAAVASPAVLAAQTAATAPATTAPVVAPAAVPAALPAVASVASAYTDALGSAMLTPAASAKSYWGNGTGSVSTGTAGNDTFNIYSTKDTVIETAGGVSTVVATFYAPMEYTLPDNVKNLTISGTSVSGVGNGLGNLIVAQGSGALTLDGGAGNDVLVANAGADTFVMNRGGGNDVVYGFKAASDTVRIGAFGFSTYAAVQAASSQVGGDVVIKLDATDSVTLRNTSLSQLSAANFGLAIDTSKLKATFDDEFNGFTSSADGSKGWRTTYNYEGIRARTLSSNNEAQYYSDASVGVNPFSNKDGVLTITAAPAAPGSAPAGYSLTHTSGLITTQNSFSQLYGYFEMRAQLPSGAGFWPAFWMLPANGSWPPEADILEQYGNDPGTVYQTLHTNTGGYNTQLQTISSLATASGGYHTYGMDWEADTVTWYIDGTAVRQVATPAEMHTPMYMLLDLAVAGAGSWAGTADGTSSAQMKIDYVRAYAPTQAHAPVTTADSYSASAGQSLTVTAANGVLRNDLDQNGQSLVAALAKNGAPQHGTVSLNADGSFVYKADAGFTGTDSFAYVASDSAAASTATTVSLTVASRAPLARADRYTDNAGQSLTVAAGTGVLANDAGQNGLALNAALTQGGGPAHGTLALARDGSFVYTPDSGFAGTDSFTYVASDSLAASTAQTVTLAVAARAPWSRADHYSTNAGQALTVAAPAGVLANDTEQNGLVMTAGLAPGGAPAHGSLSLNQDGSFVYKADAGFAGTDSFTYVARDSLGQSSPATVSLAVWARNPWVHTDQYSMTAGAPLTVAAGAGVLANDSGQNGVAIKAALAQGGGPAHGTLALNDNGSFTYTPTAGYTGWDNFSYVASDSVSTAAATGVAIHVLAHT